MSRMPTTTAGHLVRRCCTQWSLGGARSRVACGLPVQWSREAPFSGLPLRSAADAPPLAAPAAGTLAGPVKLPVQGYCSGGPRGAVRGLGRGVAGLLTRPLRATARLGERAGRALDRALAVRREEDTAAPWRYGEGGGCPQQRPESVAAIEDPVQGEAGNSRGLAAGRGAAVPAVALRLSPRASGSQASACSAYWGGEELPARLSVCKPRGWRPPSVCQCRGQGSRPRSGTGPGGRLCSARRLAHCRVPPMGRGGRGGGRCRGGGRPGGQAGGRGAAECGLPRGVHPGRRGSSRETGDTPAPLDWNCSAQ
jgi:hypothetical protein